MNANYAEICRVGNLETDSFSEILTRVLWDINNSSSAKKSKKFFLRQKVQKNHFTVEIVSAIPIFGCEINFTVIFWKQDAETEKTNSSW